MTEKKTKADYPNLLKGKGINSTERARELGRKGGTAFGQKHKERKALKERLELALDIYTEKLKQTALAEGKAELAKEIDAMGAIPFKLLDIMTSKTIKAETRLRAMAEIMDRTDGKAIQKNEITGKDGEVLKIRLDFGEPLANQGNKDKVEPDETGDNFVEDND
jgi:hypothetical protein